MSSALPPSSSSSSSSPLSFDPHAALTAGDLVFYGGDGFADRLIKRATGGGPYTHCEVVLDSATTIAALGVAGVVRHALPTNYLAVAHTGAALSAAGRARGIAWLSQQVGHPYSWLEILEDGVRACLPAWLGGQAPLLVAPSQYDCSTLATCFLIMAGYPLPPALVLDPYTVSPNTLWQALTAPMS